MRVGVLTGGGDCPGLNAVIRGIVIKGEKEGYEIIGFTEGWLGVLENRWRKLGKKDVEDIQSEGGTILFTSRTNPYKESNGSTRVKDTLKKEGIEALIAIGGDDTLGVANRLYQEGIKTVGVPKTIDNDLSATDYTFGFDTAVNIAIDGMDRLSTTARSHHRALVVEIMGRHAGWITLYAGVGAGASIVLIPEIPFHIEEICDTLVKRKKEGNDYTIIAVAEGAKAAEGSRFLSQEVVKGEKIDDFGHILLGGIATLLEKEIPKRTGIETRSVILGHLQRGGRPSAFDRFLATRFGLKAIGLVKERRFGQMTSLKGTEIISVSLQKAVGETKRVPQKLYDEVVVPLRGE